jgi:hypothetical protein
MNIDKNKKESLEIIDDLNLIFEHLNKCDGKYLSFIKTTVLDDSNKKIFEGFSVIDNLVASEIVEICDVFMKYIKASIAKNECKCKQCQEAIKILKGVLNA